VNNLRGWCLGLNFGGFPSKWAKVAIKLVIFSLLVLYPRGNYFRFNKKI